MLEAETHRLAKIDEAIEQAPPYRFFAAPPAGRLDPVQRACLWPALDPLPAVEDTEATAEQFPFDALGPVAGSAAAAIARKVQSPSAIAAGSVLATIALATQPLADVELPHGAASPLSLAIVTAAASGDRKSATDAIACEPLESYRREQFRVYAREMEAWEAKKGVKGERPPPPTAKSLIVSKGTTEGLTKLLRHQSHIGLFSPDGADVLAGHSMTAERRTAGIAWHLRAWSGESLDNLTAGEGLTAVAGRRVSMHLLVQPVVLQALMADPLAQGQGLIARCLISAPATLAGTRFFRLPSPEDEAAIAAFHQRIAYLLSLPPAAHPDGDGLELHPRRMRLSDTATALWIEFHDELERRMAPSADLEPVRPWTSKAAEQAARIAAALTLLADPEATAVPPGELICGMRVANFYLGEHLRLMRVSAGHERTCRLHALLGFLKSRGSFVPHADVLQYAPRSVRSLKADGITSLLEELTRRGYVRRDGARWEVRP